MKLLVSIFLLNSMIFSFPVKSIEPEIEINRPARRLNCTAFLVPNLALSALSVFVSSKTGIGNEIAIGVLSPIFFQVFGSALWYKIWGKNRFFRTLENYMSKVGLVKLHSFHSGNDHNNIKILQDRIIKGRGSFTKKGRIKKIEKFIQEGVILRSETPEKMTNALNQIYKGIEVDVIVKTYAYSYQDDLLKPKDVYATVNFTPSNIKVFRGEFQNMIRDDYSNQGVKLTKKESKESLNVEVKEAYTYYFNSSNVISESLEQMGVINDEFIQITQIKPTLKSRVENNIFYVPDLKYPKLEVIGLDFSANIIPHSFDESAYSLVGNIIDYSNSILTVQRYDNSEVIKISLKENTVGGVSFFNVDAKKRSNLVLEMNSIDPDGIITTQEIKKEIKELKALALKDKELGNPESEKLLVEIEENLARLKKVDALDGIYHQINE